MDCSYPAAMLPVMTTYMFRIQQIQYSKCVYIQYTHLLCYTHMKTDQVITVIGLVESPFTDSQRDSQRAQRDRRLTERERERERRERESREKGSWGKPQQLLHLHKPL